MPSNFDFALSKLLEPIDRAAYGPEAIELERCRNTDDLMRIASRGWLSPASKEPRLKLVKHGSGTFLVVAYDHTGWSTRISMQAFR